MIIDLLYAVTGLLAAVVMQWLSDRQQEQLGAPMASSSRPSAVLLAYHQVDRMSGVKSWRLLQYDGLLQSRHTLLHYPSASNSGSSSNSRTLGTHAGAGSLHPLSSQMVFSAVLSTVSVQVRTAKAGGQLRLLIGCAVLWHASAKG